MSRAATLLAKAPPHGDPPIRARRQVSVFGAPAEVVHVPQRAARRDTPGVERPLFLAAAADGIIAAEAFWREGHLAATPNIHPFGTGHILVWECQPVREPGVDLLALLFELEEQVGGTAMVNTMGAAASIPRAHGHLLTEDLPFLDHLVEAAKDDPPLPAHLGADVVLLRKTGAFPTTALGLRGPAAARATAVAWLLEHRATPAINLVAQRGTTWLFPRTIETPAPWFPWALGCAELWGRWCCPDRVVYEQLTGEDLEHAIGAALVTPDPRL